MLAYAGHILSENYYGKTNMKRKKITPRVYNWYLDKEEGESFMVIYLDEDEGLVEIQYLNGDTAEFDLEEWADLSLKKIEQPEDWTGAMDELESDYQEYG